MAAVRTMLKRPSSTRPHSRGELSFERRRLSKAPRPSRPPDAPAQGFKIEFTRLGRVIECGPDQFILDAARAAGMRLPFSCSKGMCGTCKTKKLVGNVDMNHAGGIRQREIDAGMILICCSKPLSDVVLEK
jgi:ferredoxin